jgi:hypothetical protein
MKTKMLYLSACMFLMFTACDNTNNRTTGDNDRGTVVGEDRNTTNDNRRNNGNVGGLFTASYEDLLDDKAKVEEKVRELKQERATRARTQPAKFDSLISSVEERVQMMERKAVEYRDATDDDRRSRIKEEFDLLENEAKERLDMIEDQFVDN